MSAARSSSRLALTTSESEVMERYLQIDPSRRVQFEEEAIVKKWKKSGWLNSEMAESNGWPILLDDRAERNMALILENQRVFQAGRTVDVDPKGKVHLVQDTTTADEALPTKFALPIVRRAYALLMQRDFSVVQPLPGPSAYVFWLDFLRESDSTNILSTEYNWALTPELGVPPKGKLSLNRVQLNVVKQLMGTTFSLEAQEDARAQLGLDIENELIGAFSEEFARNLFGRHIKTIYNSSIGQSTLGSPGGLAVGQNMPSPWLGPNNLHAIAARGGATQSDYKAIVYATLIDADADFQRANRRPSDTIICGYGLAAFLQKINTATQSQAPSQNNLASIGITDYGTYAGRWQIWGTDFLPDSAGMMYLRNPAPLYAAHIYAPYVPLQVMPAIYGDYDATTGNYQNKDAWTRNIRERSADIVTKPYGFQALSGPATLTGF